MNCRYCTNYHLNSNERLDNSCLGIDDCRSMYFTCNEDLKPKRKSTRKKNKSVEEMIKELEIKGYTVTRPR